MKVAEQLRNVVMYYCRSELCSGPPFASFRLFTALQQMGLQKYIKEQMLATIFSLFKHLFVYGIRCEVGRVDSGIPLTDSTPMHSYSAMMCTSNGIVTVIYWI